MLKVFCGSDTLIVRQTVFDLVGELEEKGATVTAIDGDSYVPGVLNDAAGATSLFGGEELYVLDTPSVHKEFATEVKDSLELLKESSNTFVVIEGPLLAAEKKPYQKFAETFEEIKSTAGERFNVFAMADALSRKDKKTLWLLLQEAKVARLSEEEIIGTLWWQLKSLRIAAATNSASEAGMKEFPYNKAKRALSKFQDGELETTSHSLLSIYHDGHAGRRELDLALEHWVLTL